MNFVLVAKINAQESLESILENLQNESNVSFAMEDLERIINFPIDLSNASANEIAELPAFNIVIAEKIVEYLANNKQADIDAIAQKVKLSPIQIKILRLANLNISKNKEVINPKESSQEIKQNLNHNSNFRFYSRLASDKISNINFQQNKTYENTNKHFLSIPNQKIQIGIATDKDLNEPNNIDTYSGFIKYQKDNLKIITGNYQISSASGLVFGRGLSANKGIADNGLLTNNSSNILGYTGSSDYLPFRGGGVSYHIDLDKNKISVNAYISNNQLSYSLDTNGNGVTLYKNGLYRDSNELSKKGNTKVNSIGTTITFGSENYSIGLNYLNSNYNRLIFVIDKYISNINQMSLFCNISSNDTKFVAELAKDVNSNFANISSVTQSYNKGSLIALFRYYSKNYTSPYGRAFAEHNNMQDEIGLYLANEFNKGNLNSYSYLDFFGNSKKDITLPSQKSGMELFQSLRYSFPNDINLKLLLRFKKQGDFKIENNINVLNDWERLQSKIEISSNFNKLYCKFWTGITYYNTISSKAKGNEIGIELKYNFVTKTMIGLRYSHFSINSFDAAIWSYEQIYPNYGFSQPLLGDGNRNQIFISQYFSDNVRIWFRFLDSHNLQVTENIYESNANNKFNFQCDINF